MIKLTNKKIRRILRYLYNKCKPKDPDYTCRLCHSYNCPHIKAYDIEDWWADRHKKRK